MDADSLRNAIGAVYPRHTISTIKTGAQVRQAHQTILAVLLERLAELEEAEE